MSNNVNIIWEPLEGSQSLALSYRGHHIMMDGTRGGGKTEAQLMYFRQFVGQGYGEQWRGVIFDREYKNLDDIVARSKRWFNKFGDGARFIGSGASYKWKWQTGEELLFRAAKSEDDYWAYHGQEFPFIGWNELTKYPTPALYDSMMSCNRTSFIAKGDQEDMPLIVFSTSNPYGAGHNWVKKRFVSPAKPGELQKQTTMVFNPRTQEEELITKLQVRLFSSWRENKYLTPEYIADLMNIKDENKRKAWLYGDWDIVSGGAFDDVWDARVHAIEPFEIPSGWYIDRSFDWGSSSPFSALWFAEADGESHPKGKYYPKGTVFCVSEWYGCEDGDNSKGLYMKSSEVAEGIVTMEDNMPFRVNAGVADSAIFAIQDGESTADRMEEHGCYWEECSKGKGSRVMGLETVREYLSNSLTEPLEKKGLYIFNNCKYLLENLPVLPRDSKKMDDVDTDANDHDYDALRYRLTTHSHRTSDQSYYETR